ncbi:MAG: TlpA family protein disulfide reductase [Saprospiraceae bacterium]|jgi:thiol-disulfide isomerase/thioredoxin|nr:TlpA family protein disulfide reductase [Saprospiraceae bacterium]MBP9209467.1 TlpA family protein disulfide reductase [Saprospiraceae bacterium]MBV6471909.1 hypothetical protein [Saprospiraceae bacterium]
MVPLALEFWDTHFSRHLKGIAGLGILLCIVSCVQIPNRHEGLAPGPWRGLLFIDKHEEIVVTKNKDKIVERDTRYEDKSTFVAFLFDIQVDAAGQHQMVVKNGRETLQFNFVYTGKNANGTEDSFYVDLSPYDACLSGIYDANKMQGSWKVLDKPGYSMPFEARFGQDHRYQKTGGKVTPAKLGSIYQCVFSPDSADAYSAVGEFVQNEWKVEGTFRTETGDFRYLSGDIDGDYMKLSCFDGAHAFLFTAEIGADTLTGIFYSGVHYQTNWHGTKVERGILRNPDSLSLPSDGRAFEFGFETPEGSTIHFSDSAYAGKIKIVQILGSWCPNCMDEAVFLKEYFARNPDPEIAIVGLAFERYPEREKAMARIRRFSGSLGLPYPVAYGGRANRDSAAAAVPQISGVLAFPTMLFVDRNNQIYKVHTGFDGPATSAYANFESEFKNTLEELKRL